MENLLKSADFMAVVNKHRKSTLALLTLMPDVHTDDCSDALFDVSDYQNNGTIIQPQGTGQAHYFNSSQNPIRNMRFIAYEHFIDMLGDYSKGWKRADLIAYDTSNRKSYFIIQELSVGKLHSKEGDARIQMQNTLLKLWESPRIKDYIQGFANRWCVVSATEGLQPTPRDMSEGFNAIYNVIPDPIPVKAAMVEKRQFKMWKTINVKL